MPLDSGILEMTTCCIFSIYYQATEGFTARDLLVGGISGVLQLNGRIFMALGVSEGLGGPAQSLMSTNAVVMTVLTCIVDKQSLSTYQLLGLISGLTGAFIIAMGDIIFAKMSRK